MSFDNTVEIPWSIADASVFRSLHIIAEASALAICSCSLNFNINGFREYYTRQGQDNFKTSHYCGKTW